MALLGHRSVPRQSSVYLLGVLGGLAALVVALWFLWGKGGYERPPAIWIPLLRLEQALTDYRSEHGHLPLCESVSADFMLSPEQCHALRACLWGSGQSTDRGNRRGKRYLMGTWEKPGLCDSWGTPLRVVYDADRDGKIAGALISGVGDVELKLNCFVIWSAGPDSLDEEPYTDRMDGKNADNIWIVR